MMIHIMGEHGSKLTNVHEVDVQPNAVDLRLGKVFIRFIEGQKNFFLTKMAFGHLSQAHTKL